MKTGTFGREHWKLRNIWVFYRYLSDICQIFVIFVTTPSLKRYRCAGLVSVPTRSSPAFAGLAYKSIHIVRWEDPEAVYLTFLHTLLPIKAKKSEISSSQSVVRSCHAVRMHPSRLPQSCHDSIINLSATPATLARKVKRSNSLPMCETIFMSRCYVSQRGMDLFTSSWPTPVVALPSVTFSWLPTYTAFPRFSTVGRLSRSASDHEVRDS